MQKILYLAIVLSFIIGITLGSSTNVIGQTVSIPNWVKTTAKLWGEGQIGDTDFVNALQWLISQGIIHLPTSNNNNSISPTSTITSTTNPLLQVMPTNDDMGSNWDRLSSTTSSRFDILQQASPPSTPIHTIDEIYKKTTATSPTVVTIDIANFQTNGMSTMYEETASNSYIYLLADYKTNHKNYQESVFNPIPSDSKARCSIYTITTTESTKIDLFCVKGFTVFVIDASGNDLSMSDDIKKMANLILPKLLAF